MLSTNPKKTAPRSRTTFGVLFALSLLLAACSGSPAVAPTVDEAETLPASSLSTDAPSTPEPASGSGLCANAFFPVVEGATWSFSGSSFGGDFFWVSTITAVTDSGFTLSNQFDELVATQQWSCSPEGLVALEYGGGPEATNATSGVSGSYETTGVTGVTIPNDLAAGDTWEQSFSITGSIEVAEGISATTSGSVTQAFTAITSESLTVPAGTFDALRVEGVLSYDLEVNMGEGLIVPMNFSSQIVNWYVPGIGWIKSDSTATIEDSDPISAFTELESYSIP
jgi:hypothetical protein